MHGASADGGNEMKKLMEMVRGIVWCAVALYAVTFIREGGAA